MNLRELFGADPPASGSTLLLQTGGPRGVGWTGCYYPGVSGPRTFSLNLDTSVVGGYYDPEFMADTRALWRLMEAGRFRFVSSQLVIDEIAGAPKPVRELMRMCFTSENVLDVSVEMEDLAAAYIAPKVVPAVFADDAQHVAVCAVARFDYLVGWNFKHLANARREAGFNAVNLL